MAERILIPHGEATGENLADIIRIKSQAWPYSFERQKAWIDQNLKSQDVHFLLYSNGATVAYLNLIDLVFRLDGRIQNGYGIGNVCAAEKGKGWGKEIMRLAGDYLLEKKHIGLLFCKPSLVNFYRITGWELLDKSRFCLDFDHSCIETMIFNCREDFRILDYSGIPF